MIAALLDDYAQATGPSEAARHGPDLASLPADPQALAAVIQGLLVHEHLAGHYGEAPSEARLAQSHLRGVGAMLDAIIGLDPAPLGRARPPERRAVGVCRHFSLLATAAFRAHAIPARARCGFGTYFAPGKAVDHWIVEHWNGVRWVCADFQIDALQRRLFGLEFDPLDQPPGKFLRAGEAWRLCRSGGADPADFGIFDMAGLWFIAANLVRDIASLNRMEMLPWDDWGGMALSDAALSPADLERFDGLAELAGGVDDRFDELRALYEADPRLKPPREVFNAVRGRLEMV
jgi:hypothetical protein